MIKTVTFYGAPGNHDDHPSGYKIIRVEGISGDYAQKDWNAGRLAFRHAMGYEWVLVNAYALRGQPITHTFVHRKDRAAWLEINRTAAEIELLNSVPPRRKVRAA